MINLSKLVAKYKEWRRPARKKRYKVCGDEAIKLWGMFDKVNTSYEAKALLWTEIDIITGFMNDFKGVKWEAEVDTENSPTFVVTVEEIKD